MEKLKAWMGYISGLVVLVLSALLFRQKRKTEETESELVHEKTTTEIRLNDQAREAAKANADNLVDEYERSRR
jgi:hypothetical protein